MTEILPEWRRPHYQPGGGDAYLFYVVYGPALGEVSISPGRYRCDGVPDGISIMGYGPSERPEVVRRFREGAIWQTLRLRDADLANAILAEERCVVISGRVTDPPSLNYFRNVIGLVTFLLDHGGMAVYDPHMLKWWSAPDWRDKVFSPAAAEPHTHVTILASAEADGTEWLHTRGLRKFGRPDLSIHRVAATYRDNVIDLCNRFIELQALGGVIPEGQEVRMPDLPPGLRCFHGGHEDDPDFNNVHVAVELRQR
jgi:hypothetical protein